MHAVYYTYIFIHHVNTVANTLTSVCNALTVLHNERAQTDFHIISQRATTAKTKLTDNNESKTKINRKKRQTSAYDNILNSITLVYVAVYFRTQISPDHWQWQWQKYHQHTKEKTLTSSFSIKYAI